MVEASVVVNAATGLLTVILTGLLVYFYRSMRDTQAKQADLQEKQIELEERQIDIQETQVEIQESQIDLEEKQIELIRGQNRPFLIIDDVDAENETFKIQLENNGNGIIKRLDCSSSIYILKSEIEKLGNISNKEAITTAPLIDKEIVDLSELDLADWELLDSLSAGRPEPNSTKISSIPPTAGETTCYITPKYNIRKSEDSDVYEVGEMLDFLGEFGISTVFFEWHIRYEDLSGIIYFRHLEDLAVRIEDCNNLETVVEFGNIMGLATDEVVIPDYHEFKHSDDTG